MTRLAPQNPPNPSASGVDRSAVPAPVVRAPDPATAWTPRTRRVALVVALLLLVHVLAVLVLLFVARTAAAETEAKLATLPWAFPKVVLAAPQAERALPSTPRPGVPIPAAWQPPPSRDVPAPWRTDSQGHITWMH